MWRRCSTRQCCTSGSPSLPQASRGRGRGCGVGGGGGGGGVREGCMEVFNQAVLHIRESFTAAGQQR